MTQKRTKTKDTVFALNKNMQKGQVYLFLLAIYCKRFCAFRARPVNIDTSY